MPKAAPSSVAAKMCGTPKSSRRMVTSSPLSAAAGSRGASASAAAARKGIRRDMGNLLAVGQAFQPDAVAARQAGKPDLRRGRGGVVERRAPRLLQGVHVAVAVGPLHRLVPA